jgi:hypothetical protein
MKRIIALLLLLAPLWGRAQRFQHADDLVISKPVYEDLYLAGGNITINAPIHGDLIVAGGTILINDSVSNDIILAGGEINLNGPVGDDIRFFGGKLYINHNVAGDVVITGGTLHIARKSTIGGSLITAGGEVTVDGTVNGYVKAAGGSLALNGRIGRNLDSRGQKISVNGTVGGDAVMSASEIYIGQDAAFANTVRYWSNKPVNFRQSVRKGNALADESLRMKQDSWKYLGFASIMALLWYLGAALVFIVLIQYLFGRYIQRAVMPLSGDNVLRSIGYGFLFFVLVPIAIFFAVLTLVGIPLAVLMFILYIALILIASVITSVVLANWFNIRYYQSRNLWRQVWTALVIFVVIKLISLIPVAGWLFMMAVVCLAFGLLLVQFFKVRRERLLAVPQY